MPVPKRKRSKARRDKRFANKGIKMFGFSTCKNCDEPAASHAICKNCGFYKGRKVIAVTKTERQTKRAEVKKARQARQAGAQGQNPVITEPDNA